MGSHDNVSGTECRSGRMTT